MRMLRSGDPQAALIEASELVQRRPMPAENLFALAFARQRAGQPGLAMDTTQAAARRGWRVVPLQQLQIEIALQAGVPEEAANRLAALWALKDPGKKLGETPRAVLATDQGRKAFARQIAGTSKWQNSFLQEGADIVAPDVFADTIGLAANAGARFDCPLLSRKALALALQGHLGAADTMWAGQCARAAPSSRRDGSDQLETAPPPGPFDWHFPEHALVYRDIRWSREGWEMDYSNEEPLLKQIALPRAAVAVGQPHRGDHLC